MTILSAKLANENGDAVEVQTEESGVVMICLPPHSDNIAGGQEAYELWLLDSNTPTPYVPLTPDPILAAEDWVSKFFSAVQLLKMAMWVQQKTQTNSVGPKLGAVYMWEESITVAAMQGSMEFPDSPYTFAEVAAEVLLS